MLRYLDTHLNTSNSALQKGTTWSWVKKVSMGMDTTLRLMEK